MKPSDPIHQSTSKADEKVMSRRKFMETMALGGGALVLLSGCAQWALPGPGGRSGEGIYTFIAVDYTKCTGCRTCEAVCAASNHPLFKDGGYRSDLGNPVLANIRVHAFNPDVDAPVTCARCKDTPCINACPVEPDSTTGRGALFQDAKLGVITNDPKRCIGCGSCVEACAASSVGILAQNPETNRPMRMCTLCDGKPQCVEHCPYEALSVLRVNADYEFYRMSPEDIASRLNKQWYDLAV
ncbi:MAG: 4Fe-4S dicluster domain-containing protein [Desulfobacterales bacterium]|nr:4Fe-4S dicluster domain-containing protein [Desulfobacterales bacterium]